jgi:hypothetical protein
MTLHALVEFEVRNGGNDSNGGGFKAGASGVDRSLQDAAHAVLTAASVVHTTTTQVNVDAGDYTVTADDVGNLLQITGGTATADLYEITAVDTGNNRWTLDKSAGTAGQTVVGRMGGAFATPGKAAQYHLALGLGHAMMIKYHASAYVFSTGTANVAGGPLNIPNFISQRKIIGYDTDRTINNNDANRPTIQVPGGGSITNITMMGTVGGSARGNYWRNLIADGNSQTGITGFYGDMDRGAQENCKAINCTNRGFWTTRAIRCAASGCSGQAAFEDGYAESCVAHDNSVSGFKFTWCKNCLSESNSGASSDGFEDGNAGSYYYDCRAYNNGRHGFLISNSSNFNGGTFADGILAYGNGGYGLVIANQAIIKNWAAGGNTSGNVSGSGIELSTLVALTADPFEDAAGGDFNINDAAGGGALLRAMSYDMPS